MLLLLHTHNYCTQWESKNAPSHCISRCLGTDPCHLASARDGGHICSTKDLGHQPVIFPVMLLLFGWNWSWSLCSGRQQQNGASAPPNVFAPL